jgi:hypothetical protein
MSDYSKATNFTTKDTLPTGNSNKIVKGTELDTEFIAIASAISSKADVSSPALLGTPTAPTASLGTNTTQIATTAFAIANGVPSGSIVLWSGSIASIPTGWVLCNGSSGTPDLRNRFVVGAGSTYAVAATGGTADAVVVSHTHSVSDPTHTHGVYDPGHVHGLPSVLIGNYNAETGRTDGAQAQTVNATYSAVTGIGIYGAYTGISVATTGVSGTGANLPPYYALAYIMKS